MHYLKSIKYFLVFLLTATFLPLLVFAAEQLPHADTYVLDPKEMIKVKSVLDDVPKDLVTTYPPEKALPSAIHKFMITNIEESERRTEELVGFKAPDLVGKIAPEIKPGKYTYKDLEKFPGLKELLPPETLLYIRPGGLPLIGAVPEFEIIPTRQFYWHTKFCDTTMQYLGKAKQDKDGYLVARSWQGGVPFPKPSGKFKAQQVYYNFEKKMDTWDYGYYLAIESLGFTRNLVNDSYTLGANCNLKLMGRTLFPPFGWFDKRAEKNGEFMANSVAIHRPRSRAGTVVLQYRYDDPNKMDPWMIYVPSLRRIRKMAATDTQDPQGDSIYDDRGHLCQKITPIKFPYKYDIIAEREYLLPTRYGNSAMCFDSKNGHAMKGVELMRRPCYALQMTQLDNNYAYSKRMLYIDKELFSVQISANYDQRGQLYRSQWTNYVFFPEYGLLSQYGTIAVQSDHIDEQATGQIIVPVPAIFSRRDFSIQAMVRKGK